MVQEIYLIDEDIELLQILTKLFENDESVKIKRFKIEEVEEALKDIPSVIIINEGDKDLTDMCKNIRKDDDNTITPIVCISKNNTMEHRIAILKACVEYFIPEPINHECLYHTIKNIVRLMYINRRVSPLTGLPGNVQIQAEMKKRLIKQEKFAVLYCDLDNFKSYNDTYGFVKGDEIIKFAARTIAKNIHDSNSENSFIGHIGGDDFVAIVEGEAEYEEICKGIINDFDLNVISYFNETDSQRGYVEVANRKGVMEQFPLTSISIGVVVVDPAKYKNVLEIGETGAQVKHRAKTILGSSYVIDRRK